MTDKEYTYDIDKYTIGVDENGEDGIGLTIAIIKNGKINFLGNCYGENARCIDLLIKENAELKSQLRGTTHCFDEEEHNKLKEEITILSKEIDMWNSKYNDMFDENKRLKEALEAKSYCKYANKCDELDDCSREEYEDMANANTRLSVENYDLKEENKKLKEQLANNGIVSTCENCETFGVCPHSYREYDYKCECDKLKRQLENKEEKNLKLIGEIENLSKEIDMWMRKYNEVFDENRELKKQLKDKVEDYKRMKDNFDSKVDALTKIATQQKKFIKYLEDEIKRINPNDLYIGELNLRLDDIKFTQYLIYKEILQKYKSIIGVSDENNKQ